VGGGIVSEAPELAVVVVSWESKDVLRGCLDSVARHAPPGTRTVLVDNASSDGTVAAVRERYPGALVIANADNVGFARASNQGWRATAAPRVLFLNPDAELLEGTVATLTAALLARPDRGVVAPQVVHPDGTIEASTGPDLTPLAEWRQRRLVLGMERRDPAVLREVARLHSLPGERDWVSGAGFLARREALESAHGFDEGFFLYEEDADLCRRLRSAGWSVAFEPAARIRHRRGASMSRDPARARLEYHRSHLRYYARHCGPLDRAILRAALLARGLAGLVRGPVASAEARRLLRLVLRGA